MDRLKCTQSFVFTPDELIECTNNYSPERTGTDNYQINLNKRSDKLEMENSNWKSFFQQKITIADVVS